jgi:phospholipase/lecithinase/hemolysin
MWFNFLVGGANTALFNEEVDLVDQYHQAHDETDEMAAISR